ncbi:MAG: class II glutamine amidotransferase [Tistlia sp.]|uniref:class II glutamine amidotransferase n=1 Tax=Tistlia sp. TaxID=3057121 RepID=UPI0034A1989E
MCRWTVHAGEPVFLEQLVLEPCHSLIAQSQHAREAKAETNGDGFGLGWYGERPEPGLYREILPAWSDANLRSLCQQLRARLFFAHVRASTGTATARANCHPFAFGRWLFMHNGQIGGYERIRRRVEALIPDALYGARHGTTDSEALFLAIAGRGLEADPVGAVMAGLAEVEAIMAEAEIAEPLRFTAALSDGERVYGFRYSSDDKAPTLYVRDFPSGTVLASEPLDIERGCWHAVPPNALVSLAIGGRAEVAPLPVAARRPLSSVA